MTEHEAREPGLTEVFGAVLRREMTLAFRHRGELINPLMFFVIVITLFPLGIGPELNTLQRIAPGIIWVAALLATLLSLDTVFRSDFEDGSLEQMVLSPQPLALIVIAKLTAHWMLAGLPLILLAPLLGYMLAMPSEALLPLMFTLVLGTPVLTLIGAIGVALTVGLNRGSALLSLLVLPLYIPLLIFAASAVDTAASGMSITGHLLFLGALLVFTFTLAPLAISAALKISTN
ncbi:MAG TPA: heme exporter protein CcmB [Gammaproteobacteria bacterium]|nr:heme exporter protein CcmB [Gammaproteobacteria bacterium]